MKCRWLVASLVLGLLAGCHKKGDNPPPPPPPPPPPTTLHTTYRVLSGVSMGAIGTSTVGMKHPEMFDALAPLGGPIDVNYFTGHFIEGSELGGFCSLSQIEAQLAIDPNGLNDPRVMTCMSEVPGTVSTEHTQSFNHWRFTTSGGHFTRSSYVNLFTDLALAFGNFASYNPDSPFAPAGLDAQTAWNPPADICTNPVRIKGKLSDPTGHPIYSKEYNPEGKYDAITFCDGEEEPVYYCVNTMQTVDFCAGIDGGTGIAAGGVINPIPDDQAQLYAEMYCNGPMAIASDATGNSDAVVALYQSEEGRFDPCRAHTKPLMVTLAIDYNGNGRRDYAEPPIYNSHERFSDVGADGCPDALEDGKGGCVSDPSQSPHAQGVADPNKDNYDFNTNPLGTEGNWAYDQGEPFEDTGLDGVAGTGDYGEGNGKYDESPNLSRLRSYDPVGNYAKLTPAQRKLIDLYIDGGRRDVFNLGVNAQLFFGLISALNPGEAQGFTDFSSIPNDDPTASEDDIQGDQAIWTKVPRNVLEFYGTVNPTPAELAAGDGDHVGTDTQALHRFQFMESWAANRWTALPLPPKPADPGDFNSRESDQTFFSPSLNANRNFSIYLPPGYNDPTQANQRYPVLYLLHGYGQDASSFAITSVALFEVPMSTYVLQGVEDLDTRKYIAVFPSGRCCFTNNATGERDCTFAHDGDAAWTGSCVTGSFYVNSAGLGPDGGDRYEDSLIDLVHYVDENYRTLAPADVTTR
jgi:poly(3-hydroxybutyrate) depolymerase